MAQKVSDKTRANMKSCLHDFWQGLRRRRVLTLAQIPKMPSNKCELGFRQTVDMEMQAAMISEVHRISYAINPKVWIGIKWLSVYIAIRPGELLNIQERHIDREAGDLFIPHPKEKTPKVVPLLAEDVELLLDIPMGLPELYFFRHQEGISGATPPGASLEGDTFINGGNGLAATWVLKAWTCKEEQGTARQRHWAR